MDFSLAPEQALLQSEARKLSREVFRDRAAHWDRNEEVPWDNIRLLGEKGYMGLMIPEQYGGTGATLMDLEIGRAHV